MSFWRDSRHSLELPATPTPRRGTLGRSHRDVRYRYSRTSPRAPGARLAVETPAVRMVTPTDPDGRPYFVGRGPFRASVASSSKRRPIRTSHTSSGSSEINESANPNVPKLAGTRPVAPASTAATPGTRLNTTLPRI